GQTKNARGAPRNGKPPISVGILLQRGVLRPHSADAHQQGRAKHRRQRHPRNCGGWRRESRILHLSIHGAIVPCSLPPAPGGFIEWRLLTQKEASHAASGRSWKQTPGSFSSGLHNGTVPWTFFC